MKRSRFALAASLVALGAAALATSQGFATAAGGTLRQPHALSTFAAVNFTSGCRFSHRAPDDPIVFPGEPGSSHDHSFVGNTSTDAFSTLESLQTGTTTCRRCRSADDGRDGFDRQVPVGGVRDGRKALVVGR